MTFSTKEKEFAKNAQYNINNFYYNSSTNQSNSSFGVGINQEQISTDKIAGMINET